MSTLKLPCAAARDLLDGLLDDELSGDERAGTTLHLAGCPGCRRELEQLRGLLSAARALPRQRGPEHDLWPEIAAGMARGKSAARLPSRLGVLAAAAALVLVVGAFGARAALAPPGAAHSEWPPGLNAAGGSFPSGGAGGEVAGAGPEMQGGTAGGPQGGAGGATSRAR